MTRKANDMKGTRLLTLAAAAAITFLVAACGSQKRSELKAGKADSLMYAEGKARHYERVLVLADSLEDAGDISEVNANRWRGVVYYYQGQYRSAEFYYKKVVEADIKSESDELNYYKSARRLASLLVRKGDHEGALHVAMEALWKLQENDRGSDTDAAILMNTIGNCQLKLDRAEQAARNFNHAYDTFRQITAKDSTGRQIGLAFENVVITIDSYLNAKRYEDALPWIDRAEDMLTKYRTLTVADSETIDNSEAQLNVFRAIALQGMGQTREAAQAYRAAAATRFCKTGNGRILANDYLIAAGRFGEAADNFRQLDALLTENGISLSLDNIQQYLLPKFHANVGAMRKDSAIAAGIRICNALDSAIANAKKDDAAELATIYDTQQKESQIARQQAELSKQRLVGTAIAFALAVAFFCVYTLHKRKSTHHLAIAHEKLRNAYNQLEETTAIKERIESELRIARDIQMSMVPNIFPDREGLDIYASMTPAKEVGGDLYGYMLLGDELYFCLGDVSGKGVPASLFMAQATRLFRTLAAQHMMPAEIATRMNNALAEDNEQGMFVTAFIGLADLKSGRLLFCNAGHNPPVVVGDDVHFVDMLPNAPIGLWPGLEFEGETAENIKGKRVFFYTDGLNEAENRQQQQFGDDRLLEILGSRQFGNAKEMVEALKEEVEKHRNGAEPNDDLTMMSLKIE